MYTLTNFESIVNSCFEFLFGDSSLSVYRLFAICGTLFFLVVLIFSIVGCIGDSEIDSDGNMVDLNGDYQSDFMNTDNGMSVMKLFSIRSIFAFFAMFGWGGIISGEQGFFSVCVATICGIAAMLSVAFIIRMLLRLQQNGTHSNKSLLGAVGKVYLEIPGGDKTGKVTLYLLDSTREVIAKSDAPIARGTEVSVIGVEGDIFYVQKKHLLRFTKKNA